MKTGRNIQRDMFLSSLRKQMDIMSSSMRKDQLTVNAETYLNEGCSPEEAQELLIIDGFDKDMVSACLERVSSFEQPNSKSPKWGFEAEDAYGRTVSNFDLDITITAATEKEALAEVEKLLASGDGQKGDSVTKVFRL